MLDDLFSFIDPDIMSNDEFFLFGKVEVLFESSEQLIADYDMNAAVSDKIRDIIEKQWGKRVADLQELYVGQFHERRVEDDQVSYRPSNRYILRAKFHYAQEPRQIIFSLTA